MFKSLWADIFMLSTLCCWEYSPLTTAYTCRNQNELHGRKLADLEAWRTEAFSKPKVKFGIEQNFPFANSSTNGPSTSENNYLTRDGVDVGIGCTWDAAANEVKGLNS